MLRPKRMSRVSVTGSKRVMDDAIETIHDLNLLHVTDYDDSWEGFEPGNPVEGADETSEKLVTVRALESTLDVTGDDAGRVRILDDDELDAELERTRERVNELDDRRSELRDELREIDETVEAARPFADLGIDLDLLTGYESLSVAVGEGDPEALRRALVEADGVEAFETFDADGSVALFVYPDVDLDDALVGTPFTQYEVPSLENVEATNPEDYIDERQSRRRQVESKLETVENELEDLKHEVADFLLAAEEKLSIEVQKREAPLNFATTDNAFVSEGWIPSERYTDLAEALQSELGDHVDVEELERADYRDGEFVGDHGEGDHDDPGEAGVGEPVAADGSGGAGSGAAGGAAGATGAATADGTDEDGPAADEELRADGGGDVAMSDGEPPIEQDNPAGVRPFELLTRAVGKPKYTEFDPTVVLFLTFPLMFGFMIGDIGYGLIYTGIGYWMIRNFDSETFQDFGKVAAAAGISTFVFGILYGEIFGLHMDALPVIGSVYTHAIIEKGLSPATSYWAEAWFVITALFGVFHLNLAWTFEFIEEYTFHGLRAAVEEVGSWLLALNGLWLFVFSRIGAGTKPDLLFDVFNQGEGAAFELGFAGFPVVVGWIGVGLTVVGLALLAIGPTHELVEAHQVLAHVLSYLRIAAVLLAKAGMAFAVNLLFFGAYETHGEFHYLVTHGPGYVEAEYGAEATVMFPGLLHGGAGALLAGIIVLLVGHLVVLLLGITSAGIQSVRLEYFEFFSKFYEDGGESYAPFGYERTFTAEE